MEDVFSGKSGLGQISVVILLQYCYIALWQSYPWIGIRKPCHHGVEMAWKTAVNAMDRSSRLLHGRRSLRDNMVNQSSDNIAIRRRFLQPVNAAHRQYEALRAFLVEGLPSPQAARRFGYSPGSFRVLVHHFRRDPGRPFFLPDRPPGRQRPETRRQRILALRRQNLSIYDISRALAHEGEHLTAAEKGLLAFLAQDANTRVFCYAHADLRKAEQNDEVLRFLEFWEKRTGRKPAEVIFDSRLTTYANLSQLNQWGVDFITLRRRSDKLLRQIALTDPSAWRRIELENLARQYRTPRILDQRIELSGYDGPLRQLVIDDLGHEDPTLLLTNQLRRSPAKLIGRYAQRMLIEHNIADGIDFFHMDALSSAVALKVDLDLQLTLMASGLYRLLAQRIGRGYQHAKSRRLFDDFVDATAAVDISADQIDVRFQKRSHNPLLLAAGFERTDLKVPWLGGKRLRFVFG